MEERREKVRKIAQQLNIIDDTMFQKMAGKTVYHVERVIRETGEVLDNGLYEIYVNAKIDDGSDIAQLMRIFTDDTAYDFEKFPRVSQRKRQFKEEDGGTKNMCDLVEQYAKEYAEEVAEERVKETARGNALRLFQNGGSYELVRASIPSLSDEELQAIYKEAKGI